MGAPIGSRLIVLAMIALTVSLFADKEVRWRGHNLTAWALFGLLTLHTLLYGGPDL